MVSPSINNGLSGYVTAVRSPSTAAETLPTSSSLKLENGKLVPQTWTDSLKRFFIPYHASSQDSKVTGYFLSYFKELFSGKKPQEEGAQIRSMILLAERYAAAGKGNYSEQFPGACRLEHYTLAARARMDFFSEGQTRTSIREKCLKEKKALPVEWIKHGFPEEIFWNSPDLVDFISAAYLHRFIRHADYQHTIQMLPSISPGNGGIPRVMEPHLKMEGKMTPWSEISRKISVDEEGRMFSLGTDGKKSYWMYLEEGFVQNDRHDFEKLTPFKSLPKALDANQVQIVTSHIPRSRWSFLHHLTKGNVHTHFRIIPRNGFAQTHQGSKLLDGKVYSIGYGARWDDVAHKQPLKTIPGMFYSPDSTEFFKEDLRITTLDQITDAQLLKLVEVTKKRSNELRPFNIASHNCSSETSEILSEAGVADLKSGVRSDHVLYTAFVPKFLRRGCATLSTQLSKFIPARVSSALSYAVFCTVTVMISPIFLILGAWRVKRPGPEDKRKGELKPLISSPFDLFDAEHFTINMTRSVSKWQKKQLNTVYVEQK